MRGKVEMERRAPSPNLKYWSIASECWVYSSLSCEEAREREENRGKNVTWKLRETDVCSCRSCRLSNTRTYVCSRYIIRAQKASRGIAGQGAEDTWQSGRTGERAESTDRAREGHRHARRPVSVCHNGRVIAWVCMCMCRCGCACVFVLFLYACVCKWLF